MTNGSNSWNIAYSRIAWLEGVIKTHENVTGFLRHDDIIMEITRAIGRPITLICLDEYMLGESSVRRVMSEFPQVNFISVGGKWNGYTAEAKALCLSHNIGLVNASKLPIAIKHDDFWNY